MDGQMMVRSVDERLNESWAVKWTWKRASFMMWWSLSLSRLQWTLLQYQAISLDLAVHYLNSPNVALCHLRGRSRAAIAPGYQTGSQSLCRVHKMIQLVTNEASHCNTRLARPPDQTNMDSSARVVSFTEYSIPTGHMEQAEDPNH